MTEDIEDIRERKLREMKEKAQSEQDNEAQQQGSSGQEETVEKLLRQGLTDDARQRLNALEMAKPQRAKSVKHQLASILQQGRVDTPITEEQVKEILKKVSESESKDFDINRR